MRSIATEKGEIRAQDRLRTLAQEVVSEISASDPSHSKDLLEAFVLELAFSAVELEQRELRRQKQAEGIASARARGYVLATDGFKFRRDLRILRNSGRVAGYQLLPPLINWECPAIRFYAGQGSFVPPNRKKKTLKKFLFSKNLRQKAGEAGTQCQDDQKKARMAGHSSTPLCGLCWRAKKLSF